MSTHLMSNIELYAAKAPPPKEETKSQQLNIMLLAEWSSCKDLLEKTFSKNIIKKWQPSKLAFETIVEEDNYICKNIPINFYLEEEIDQDSHESRKIFGNSLGKVINKLNIAVTPIENRDGIFSIFNKTYKFFNFDISIKWEKTSSGSIALQVIIQHTLTLSVDDLSFIPNIETKTEGAINLVNSIIQESWWVKGIILPLYDPEVEITYNPQPHGVVKVGLDNLYLPEVGRVSDKREEFLEATISGKKFAGELLYIDTVNEVFAQTNSNGDLQIISIEGYMALDKVDIVHFIKNKRLERGVEKERSLYGLFYDPDGISPKTLLENNKEGTAKVRFDSDTQEWKNYSESRNKQQIAELSSKRNKTQQEKDHIVKLQEESDRHNDFNIINASRNITLSEFYERITPAKFEEFLKRCIKVYEGKYKRKSILPYTFYKIIGTIQCVRQDIDKVHIFEKELIDQKYAFNNAQRTDKIPIPNLATDKAYMPHQAEGVSKTDKAGETLVFNVSPGGGKTLLIITDIINLMYKKEVKKPLIITTNNLIGQFMGEITEFTGKTFNSVVISTETRDNWSKEKLEHLMENSPPNTIFFSTYVFLTLGKEENSMGGITFPNIDWIKKYLKLDYIALDEAHYIKNESLRQKACMALRGTKYRRIATGTILPNTIMDLCGPIGFLNPRIFGSKEKFSKDFGIILNQYKEAEFVSAEASKNVFKRLDDTTFHVQYTEKDWAVNLPDIEFNYHRVELSESQKAAYEKLVLDTEENIEKNYPKLAKKWQEFKQDPTKSEKIVSNRFVLGLMTNLEQFLTMPSRSEFVQYVNEFNLNKADLVSPKIYKIDELIGLSLQANMKCIVGTHFIAPAKQLMEDSKYRNQAVFFDSSHKEALLQFKNDHTKKVMFCVVQNITEGHNLQMCNRIILADIDWTPGKLTQLKARMFRPNIEKVGNELINKNVGKKVYIDYVLCNHSADIVKFCYQTYKKLDTASVLDNITVDLEDHMATIKNSDGIEINVPAPGISKPRITVDTLHGDWVSMNGDSYEIRDKEYYKELTGIIHNAKLETKNANPWIPITHTRPNNLLGTELIPAPWIIGMPLPEIEDYTSIADYLDRENIQNYIESPEDEEEGAIKIKEKDIKEEFKEQYIAKIKSKLEGKEVYTEFYEELGIGEITSVSFSSVSVKFKNGTRKTIKMARALVKDAPTVTTRTPRRSSSPSIEETVTEKILEEVPPGYVPKTKISKVKTVEDSKPAQVEESGGKEDNSINIDFAIYNGIPTLVVDLPDPDAVKLKTLKFLHQGPMWLKRIASKSHAVKIILAIQKEYKIPVDNYDEILKALKYFNKDTLKFNFTGGDIKEFIGQIHEPKNNKIIKLMPLVKNNMLFFVADVKTNPSLEKFEFKKRVGMWYHFEKNKSITKKLIRRIEKDLGLTISNEEEFNDKLDSLDYKIH